MEISMDRMTECKIFLETYFHFSFSFLRLIILLSPVFLFISRLFSHFSFSSLWLFFLLFPLTFLFISRLFFSFFRNINFFQDSCQERLKRAPSVGVTRDRAGALAVDSRASAHGGLFEHTIGPLAHLFAHSFAPVLFTLPRTTRFAPLR